MNDIWWLYDRWHTIVSDFMWINLMVSIIFMCVAVGITHLSWRHER